MSCVLWHWNFCFLGVDCLVYFCGCPSLEGTKSSPPPFIRKWNFWMRYKKRAPWTSFLLLRNSMHVQKIATKYLTSRPVWTSFFRCFEFCSDVWRTCSAFQFETLASKDFLLCSCCFILLQKRYILYGRQAPQLCTRFLFLPCIYISHSTQKVYVQSV